MKLFNTIFHFLLSVALAFGTVIALIGCATMIPGRDVTPPTVSLIINGPGIGPQLMNNPPRELWTAEDGSQFVELLPGTRYSFTLVVADEGGVARAHLRVPDVFTFSNVSPAEVRRERGVITRNLILFGNPGNPRSHLVISGTFTTPTTPDLSTNEVLSFEFQTEGDDFGGDSGAGRNQRFMDVLATVAN